MVSFEGVKPHFACFLLEMTLRFRRYCFEGICTLPSICAESIIVPLVPIVIIFPLYCFECMSED